MDRRNVLKKVGFGGAAIVVSPQIISMLHSCKSNVNESLVFFSKNQFQIISKTMDLIIPKTNIPGAIELKLPEFLDKYIDIVMSQNDKKNLSKHINIFIELILTETKKNHPNEISSNDLNSQLEKYLKASDQQTKRWQKTPEYIVSNTKDDFPKSQESEVYNFLIQIRDLTLNAFGLNEYIGERVLAYDPIPGGRKVCIDLKKSTGGKRWSLSSR